MLALLPFLAALVIADQGSHGGVRTGTWSDLALWAGGGLVLWAVICFLANRQVARRQRFRLLLWWDMAAQGLILAWFAFLCLDRGWAAAVPGNTLALMPYVLALSTHWFFFSIGVRGVTGQPWTHLGMLAHQLRFTALPLLLLMSALIDIGDALVARTLGQAPLALELLGLAALAIGTLALAPPLLVTLWKGRPLPPGERRDLLERACAAAGLRHPRLMLWPVPHGRVYNAAVVGIIPGLRYVLFTEDLLRDLSEAEVLAVLGHELGHARHKHLWVYVLFIATVMAIGWFAQGLLARGLLPIPATSAWLPEVWRNAALALFGVVLIWRVAFGVVSRACERQADLAGASLAGGPEAMESALKTVARLSGQPENAPNWRHYSIAQRVAFLRELRTHPTLADRHHRRMRFSLLILILIMITSLVLNWWMNPARLVAASSDPAAAIAELRQQDGELDQALRQADAGDPTALSLWYQRMGEHQRQVMLGLHLNLMNTGDDRLAYRLRKRLSAFSGIGVGDHFLNLHLNNSLAYALVAGTPEPTPQDIEQAQRLLPSLEEEMLTAPDHAIFDTIGCIHFRLGNWTRARDGFANAVHRMDKIDDLTPALRSRLESLYGKRRMAAERNAAIDGQIPGAPRGGSLLSLPLEFEPDETKADTSLAPVTPPVEIEPVNDPTPVESPTEPVP